MNPSSIKVHSALKIQNRASKNLEIVPEYKDQGVALQKIQTQKTNTNSTALQSNKSRNVIPSMTTYVSHKKSSNQAVEEHQSPDIEHKRSLQADPNLHQTEQKHQAAFSPLAHNSLNH